MCAYKINTNDKYSEIEAIFKLGEGVAKKIHEMKTYVIY